MRPHPLLGGPTRREREVNWGDKTRITGSEHKTLAWVSTAESVPLVVYAAGSVRGGLGVTFVVNVEWGHGGASIDQDFPVVRRLRVPLAASMVKVSGWLVDALGNAPPESITGEIAVVIAPGSDGETLRNTRWLAQSGAGGTISERPERVMALEGFNAGASSVWFMAFDGAGEDGDAPAMVCPARVGEIFTLRRPDSQAFRIGVSWWASSTPLVLTKDPNALLRVDAELLL